MTLEHSDAEYAEVCKTQLVPLVLFLYAQADLEIPMYWEHDVEGPRLVTALQAQGFTARFGVVEEKFTDRRRPR